MEHEVVTPGHSTKPFIVLEGLDGTGKSTVASALVAQLVAEGIPAEALHTPSDGFRLSARYVNDNCNPAVRFLFYLAAVLDASDYIRSRRQSAVVVCDRYYFSTLAYHRASGVDAAVDLNALEFEQPDFVFYLDTDQEIRAQRVLNRAMQTLGDVHGASDTELVRRIREEFSRFDMIRIDTTHKNVSSVVSDIRYRIRL